ncbi:MAG: tetratricopeptide repeat protein, partial [Candidatus Micrarchaeia archaeon]
VLIAKEEYEKAKELLEPLVGKYPEMPEGHMNLGLAYLGLNKLDKAEGEFNEAIQLKGNYAEALNNLGKVHFLKEEYKEAEEMYNKAIKADRYYVPAYVNLAELYEEQAEKQSKENPWKAQDLYKEAYSILEKCISIVGKKHARYNELLERMKSIEGQIEETKKKLRKE